MNIKQFKIIRLGMLFIVTSCSTLTSKHSGQYYNLSTNRVASEHYEIKKLINGDIDAVFFSKKTNEVLVISNGYIWKIDRNGYVVDAKRGANDLLSSGITISNRSWGGGANWTLDFNDWIYSGDKRNHNISEIIENNSTNIKSLKKRFDNANIVEFTVLNKKNKKKIKIALLKEKQQWVALKIPHHFGNVDESCQTYKHVDKTIWKKTCLEGYKRKYKNNLMFLSDTLAYMPDFTDTKLPLHIKKFVKDFYYYEEGFGGWLGMNILAKTILRGLPGETPKSYWYGTGYFQLKHKSELLNFKAFTAKIDGKYDLGNISIYKPPGSYNQDIKFIKVTYKGGEYNTYDKDKKLIKYLKNDVGFYVIRKKKGKTIKLSSTINNVTRLSGTQKYISASPWFPIFTGFFNKEKSNKALWGNISFYNKDVKSQYYLMDSAAVKGDIYTIPRKLIFDWEGNITHADYKLFLNGNDFVWLDFHRFSNDVVFELHFDEAEIVNAFKALEGTGTQLKLDVHMDNINKYTGRLSVQLRNNKKNIKLNKVTYKYVEPVYSAKHSGRTISFEKSKLKIEFYNALKNKKYLQDYFNVSKHIATHSLYVKKYAYLYAGITTTLLIKYTGSTDYNLAEKVIYHYINEILPLSGLDEKTEDVASNGLVVAILNSNNDLSQIIFSKLLGSNFDIKKTNNGILLFNLACYYSLNNEKDKMLQAIKYALSKGKKPVEFMDDSDFTNYRTDADFLKLLKH